MKQLQRFDAVWPNEQDDGWCVSYEDVLELEAYNERLRSMLQRIINEATKRRIEWSPNSYWLATSHNSDVYAIHYEINADLMNAIKAVLNNEGEQDDD